MKKIAFLICLLSANQVFAQQQKDKPTNDCAFYKWTDKGEAHYARAPKRGFQDQAVCFAYYNGYNYEVDPNGFDPNNTAIIRPQIVENPDHHAPGTENAPMPAGSITRTERCNALKGELKTLTEKQNVYEEDNAGNLIPLTKEQIESRKAQAQSQIDNLCNNNPPANPTTSGAPVPPPAIPHSENVAPQPVPLN